MVPRSGDNRKSPRYEVYICHNRDRFGRDHCSQPPVPRRVIDTAALHHLREASSDLALNQERLTRSLKAIIADNEELLQDAQLGLADVAARHGRVRRDYQDGRISAEDWTEQRGLLAQESKAEQARADRLQAHLDRMNRYLTTRAADALDQAVTTISQTVNDSIIGISLDTARATITAVFDSFTLTHDDGNYTLIPKLRPRSLMMPQHQQTRGTHPQPESDGIEVLPVFKLSTPPPAPTG
jgi:hypothetical protein